MSELHPVIDEIYYAVSHFLNPEVLRVSTKEDFETELMGFIDHYCVEKNISISLESKHEIIQHIYNDFMGFGPLESLLSDPTITEIMINDFKTVYVERFGKIEKTSISFRNQQHVINIAQRIATRIHRRIDAVSPLLNARLPDGSRVNAVLNPISLDGTCLTIRKFSKIPLTVENLVEYGTLTPKIAEFLRICTHARANVIVAGGTGAGKTTLLNVLSRMILPDERVITIEDAAELQLTVGNLIRLEAREANAEGKGEVTIYDLVRNCLRMRPDRVIIGEVRGKETFEMLKALNTGHDGSMSTIHSNDAQSAILRLENIISTHHANISQNTIFAQIASAVDLIIFIRRYRDGSRRVAEVLDVGNFENGEIHTNLIFQFHITGETTDGKIQGYYKKSHHPVSFMEKIRSYNLEDQLMACLDGDEC